MGKNVAVFVDVANIFYAAKAAGVDIDYVTLLKAATAGRDFVRAYAYTGLDPDNENQRNFHSFLARHSYKVVSKDIRKYGDGKVKANLDIELVVDMMKTARNLDIAVVISGDGDFAPAIRAVQEMGVRVEVVSFRGNTSSDLIEVADLFTDITQIAKVEKGSARSGRRVADDEEDLSMTEVPEKQTEGTGRGRGRGGRGRPRTTEPEPVVARAPRGRRSSATAPVPVAAEPASEPRADGRLVVLPGEKLSKAASIPAARDDVAPTEPQDLEAPEGVEEPEGVESPLAGAPIGEESEEAGTRRRRRRRGGRGRGRGRSGEAAEGAETVEPAAGTLGETDHDLEGSATDELEVPPAPRAPRAAAFGSFWDTQIGMPSAPSASKGETPPDEEFDEPEIPEYLIAEQRRAGDQRGRGGRGGARGGRSAYVTAMERERFGGRGGGGINRYPDVGSRGARPEPTRSEPSRRPEPPRRPDRGPRPSSDEPWSEVPPEVEAMLKAQLTSREARVDASASSEAPAEAAGPARSGRGRRSAPVSAGPAEAAAVAEAAPAAAASAPSEAEAKPKRRTTRKPAASEAASASSDATAGDATSAPSEAEAKPKRRTTRKPAASEAASASSEGTAADVPAGDAPAETAPKRRTTRKAAPTA